MILHSRDGRLLRFQFARHLIVSHPGLLSCLFEEDADLEIGIADLKALGELRGPPFSLLDLLLRIAHYPLSR